ncbi:MAG: response regulator transcription factor [Hyphomicrobiales bacterium]
MKNLRALPVSAAILNASGTIVAVNDTWKDFARQNGLRLPNFGVGSNYLQFCESDGPYPSLSAADLRELLVGQKKLLTLIYPCDSPTKKRWFSLIGLQLSPDRQAGVALLHINLTDTLPPPTGAHQRRATIQQRRQIRTTANLEAISGSIERTVLETLSSQLNTMLSGTYHQPALTDTSANLDAGEVLASTKLSKRQMEVLRLLGQGKSNKEIAKTLFRSPHTIKLHVSAILQQLKLKSRTQAALLASTMYKQRSADPLGSGTESSKRTRITKTQHNSGRSVREKASID